MIFGLNNNTIQYKCSNTFLCTTWKFCYKFQCKIGETVYFQTNNREWEFTWGY